jgi:hypothetical protein
MSHPRPDEIDLLLEGALEPDEAARMEAHLDACPACRAVREERKAFLDAISGLPDLEVPADLTARIMARVFPERRSLAVRLAAFAAGSSILVFAGLAYVLATGADLPGLLLGAGKASWGAIQSFALSFIKGLRLLALFFDLMARFTADLGKAGGRLGHMIGPEVYAATLIVALAAAAVLYLGYRRKFAHGENSHEA